MSLQVQAFLETVLKSEWEPTASCKCHSGFNALHRQSAFNSRRAAERFHFHFSCLIFFLHETGAELIWALVSFDPGEFCLTRVLSWEVTTPLCSVENERARAAIHKHGDPRRPSPLPPPARAPPFDWHFHSSRCGRSCLRARWRLLTGLFMHNNWDSWTECWTNSPPSCYTTARFHHFFNVSTDPAILKAVSHLHLYLYIYLFIIYFCNL